MPGRAAAHDLHSLGDLCLGRVVARIGQLGQRFAHCRTAGICPQTRGVENTGVARADVLPTGGYREDGWRESGLRRKNGGSAA